MIFKSLDTIPYKLFLKIEESKEYWLLDTDFFPKDELEENEMVSYSKKLSDYAKIWDELYNEHLSKNQTNESQKIFKISKTIDEYLTINKVLVMGCDALLFEYDEEVHKIIESYGFKLSLNDTNEYNASLAKIRREAKAYIIKAKRYKAMLPEVDESSKVIYNADDVMSSYSAILGFNIGKHNEVTYTEYYSHEKSVEAKIKSFKSQKSQNKKSHGK